MRSKTAGPTRIDTTLSKGLQILEVLAASPSSIGITQLAMQLELNKSNVHRLIQTLSAMNYVTQEPDRTYRASLKLWKLGNMVLEHGSLIHLASRAMHKLAGEAGEDVLLTVLDGLQALYIDKIDSEQPVRAYTKRGGTAPLYCVATGKVLLAFNYDALRDVVAEKILAHSPRTITNLKNLDQEMERIRSNDIALNLGEYRADVGGIAAPIRDSIGRVVAAIGVSGPLSRLTRQRMKELKPAVIEAAETISKTLAKEQQV
ncbi:IclR family transcriptional regulator [Ferrovibrio xuzhouensis]|uniref:IclR family transcriptional regulator n=1 Tax=Ferrovibrio xuzhouensis TaxID=1576914 RepID=A0ABV7VQP9_9PROT